VFSFLVLCCVVLSFFSLPLLCCFCCFVN
jgi:hypothetical protein